MANGDVRVLGPNSAARRRAAKAKLLAFVLALVMVLVSAASAQVLDGVILLPDSLGPLYGKNHVAFDEDSANPRIFIGGEGGDVIVANAVTCERVARIRSGPMNALCYVPAHNKLYVSTTDEYGVAVVDGSSYEVIKRLPFASLVTGLYYNLRNDRVYCASDPLRIIDCVSDSVVDSLMFNGADARCALDGYRNKLYVSAKDSLRVVDCSNDSVVASIFVLRGAQTVCFQPSAGKLYVAAGESLFAVNTKADTVVYRQGFDTLYAQLACDPVHNRVYYTYWSHLIALDCTTDSILWNYHLWGRGISLAPVPELDRLYVMLIALGYTFKYALDGSTGTELPQFKLTVEDSLYYNLATGYVFVSARENAVTAIEAGDDTLVGIVPLGAPISNLTADTLDNKLHFISQYQPYISRVGVVDCVRNAVQSYTRIYGRARGLAYDACDSKLYFSADSSIFVFDCRADTLAKEIPIDGIPCELVWYPNLNKLYAVSIFRDSVLRMNVVECSRDTVVKVLDLDPIDGGLMLPVPEFNQLWIFSQGSRYGVIDCLTDSIVGDTTNDGGNFWSVCYSPVDRKVYAAQNGGLYVMDMDTRLPVESIPMPSPYTESYLACCAARAGKVYWTVMRTYPQVELCAQAVDTRRDSIVSSSVVPNWSNGMCEDHTGDYVYIASNWLVVIDTHTDSIVSGVHLPLQTEFLVRNSGTNCFYIAGLDDSVIQVVYDSVIFAGLQAASGTPIQTARLQTVLSRSGPLRTLADAVLFDASGRKAAKLRAGANDISHLSPGVYFVREEPQSSYSKPQSVRKVVIAR